MLSAGAAALPPDLPRRAMDLGERIARRRRAARGAVWLLLFALITGLLLWAAVAEPWSRPPRETTPPVEGL
ncbi:hypothetical protein FQU76_21810 [Streptomyces qinzhouensis]|uniref:Uncharacterized protein n=2 Tax=Streptomyces qinzhouensis TaxID=2599401 RepID=A0A5B8JHX3_9ACTN|nr:hypothetical protein FQU76_21810 [Streptomyces qinzhouensis]